MANTNSKSGGTCGKNTPRPWMSGVKSLNCITHRKKRSVVPNARPIKRTERKTKRVEMKRNLRVYLVGLKTCFDEFYSSYILFINLSLKYFFKIKINQIFLIKIN
jgi:hypothetical protein